MNWILNSIFKSWKTSITAIVGAVVLLLSQAGIITIGPEVQHSFEIVILFLIGLFAKDSNVSGGGVQKT